MNAFDSISPIDYRYYGSNKAIFTKLKDYLSEAAGIKYRLHVERTLVEALADKRLCSRAVAKEVEIACEQITAEEVYAKRKRPSMTSER